MFEQSYWIWPTEQSEPNQRADFKHEFICKNLPEKAILKIAAETKYWLFVNGELAVFDGGLFRESSPGNGWYDEVDIAAFLKQGQNEMVMHVWYFGNGGRNNSYCERGGLLYECETLGLFSGEDTFCEFSDGYYTSERENPSYLFGGHNTAYDARKKTFTLCPVVKGYHAVRIGKYGDKPWGTAEKRSVPLFYFSERKPCRYIKNGDTYTVKLDYAQQFAPYMILRAKGGEGCDIRTDHYLINGGPGDDSRSFRGHRVEYICRVGEQEFEMMDWLYGERLIFTIPESVEVVEIGYRESRYDCDIVNLPKTNDVLLNKLIEKCARTLKVCMRENFMDCPDRERGQWIGDVSVQAPQVFLCLSKNAVALLRKAIVDFISLRKGDRLVGNVPGDNFCELPAQSLNAISELGMIACYYEKTQDIEILRLAFEPIIRYLKLWKTDDDGLVIARNGDWQWHDHGYNVDADVLENCWYYSAVKYALFIAEELKDNRYNSFLTERKESIEQNFEKAFWHENMYTSHGIADDRANAMAVLSGLYNKEHTIALRNLLVSVFNSTTYMEGYILEALCILGYKNDAYKRMISRYYPLIVNENSTLWEDFFTLGTTNHAWTGAPLTIISKYFPELIIG